MSKRKRIQKVVIIGDSGVGKTSLLYSYVDGKFTQSYKSTIGADFMQKEIIVNGKDIILQLWDTVGQQKYKSIGRYFYRGSSCCVLVYDITNKKSFQNIQSWLYQFLNEGKPYEPQNFPFVLIGNKIDLQSERQVSQQALSQFLFKHPKIKHIKTSAKNIESLNTAFQVIGIASLQNYRFEPMPPVDLTKLNIREKYQNKKTCC